MRVNISEKPVPEAEWKRKLGVIAAILYPEPEENETPAGATAGVNDEDPSRKTQSVHRNHFDRGDGCTQDGGEKS